jgi:hypothetical protein
MSEITQNFVVEPNNINITVDNNTIEFTPTTTQLSIYTSAPGVAGGSNTQLQFNNNQQFGGIPNVTWNGSKLSLGNVANVLMTGGTNGFVLQTDGTGNLSWTAQTGNGGGNGTPGGANTQIQYNDSGLFGGNAGFTFNEVSGNVNIPTNLILTGNLFGNVIGNLAGTSSNANYSNEALVAYTVVTNAQPNITSTGTLVNLTVSGNIDTTGTTSIQQAKEKFTSISTPTSGAITYDLLTQAIIYNTANATGAYTINFRGNSGTTLNSVMSSNESMTCTFIATTGTTGYVVSSVTVDGATPTVKWTSPGSAGVPTNSGQDIYNFNILKTAANTFTVFASRVGYA